jgi:hypothetical protein
VKTISAFHSGSDASGAYVPVNDAWNEPTPLGFAVAVPVWTSRACASAIPASAA